MHPHRLQRCHALQGNVPYMAPEQGDPAAGSTDRSDIWSFAASMLEAWSGLPPYRSCNQYQILQARRRPCI